MVPSLGVHVDAASVKATVRCPHWVAYLAKKHRYAGTTRGTSVLVAVSHRRERFWPLTRFASRKWRSGLNRISHPDWVKFSVELNCAPKQNTRFSSSLQFVRFTMSGVYRMFIQFWSRVVVIVKIPSMGQIDLFKKYSYSKRACKKENLFRNHSAIDIWILALP